MMKNSAIVKLMSRLPDKITLEVVEACFVLAFLEKNGGNKRKTCREIKISERKMRYRIRIWEDEGYHIPQYERVYNRKNR